MSALDWFLVGVIALGLFQRWIGKDRGDFKEMMKRLDGLARRHEDAYSKMRSRIEDEGEKVEAMLEKCRQTLERLHGVDMERRMKEWQAENPDEMKAIERRREAKRNPYGF